MDIKTAMKDPKAFSEANKIVTIVNAIHEIEDLTAYPVPKNALTTRRIEEYVTDTERDGSIRSRKKEIAAQHMQKAWAEEIQTKDGFLQLARMLPDHHILFVAEGKTFQGMTVSNGQIVPGQASITLAEAAIQVEHMLTDNVLYAKDQNPRSVHIADTYILIELE